MKQQTNENIQEDKENIKEKNDSNPEWIHERAESLANGMLRSDKDLRDNVEGFDLYSQVCNRLYFRCDSLEIMNI